ncbi:glycoside hydrolase family 28 protein [Echinicola soli]|uniref:Glycoside hydrolase family 28 protein n=1 Tax=Echinicola soli TaxID=2591634 RepID=A0A514CK21_9BACT|nr:glycoside hydrolase family 28 protein [Echinicola soli]QDH80195.1 glycoside hydrolase family 28 protein [Echinicola soli]
MKKQYKSIFLISALAVLTSLVQARQIDPVLDDIYEGVEIKMPKVQLPSFPDRAVSIADFGAKGDGMVKNTEAFAKAIDEVVQAGGGRVIVPRGIWLTGPITLKSNTNLHLEDGALVLFSRDFDDYPLVKTSFEGLNTVRCISPINALEAENIAITGTGVIDGNGDAWRPVKKGKMTAGQWDKLVRSGGVLSDDKKMWFPTAKSKKGYTSSTNFNVPDLISENELASVKDFLRPVMVSLVKCNKVLLDGPTFQNSPAWNIHPLMSENVVIRNLNVRNPWYSQNGDGLDLESCKNALIYNNTFDVGDDAICFKSGKNEDGRDRGMPTENVIVKNNTVYHAHGGFVVGSEMSGGVKNIHVSHCTFIGTDVGLRFKSTRGRGGVVENIHISDIDMINIPTDAIRFNMFYGGNSPVLEEDQDAEDEARNEAIVPVTEETPAFRNIYMKNIRATGSGTAAFFMGLPEKSLENVRLENALLEAKNGITVIDTDGLILKNVQVKAERTSALTVYNSKNVNVSGFTFEENGKTPVRILGKLTNAIQLDKADFSTINEQVSKGNDLPANALKIK